MTSLFSLEPGGHRLSEKDKVAWWGQYGWTTVLFFLSLIFYSMARAWLVSLSYTALYSVNVKTQRTFSLLLRMHPRPPPEVFDATAHPVSTPTWPDTVESNRAIYCWSCSFLNFSEIFISVDMTLVPPGDTKISISLKMILFFLMQMRLHSKAGRYWGQEWREWLHASYLFLF